MRIIEIEKRLTELEKNQEALKEMRRVQIIVLSEDVEGRIKMLEDARQRQIKLNYTLKTNATTAPISKSKPSWKFWN